MFGSSRSWAAWPSVDSARPKRFDASSAASGTNSQPPGPQGRKDAISTARPKVETYSFAKVETYSFAMGLLTRWWQRAQGI